MIKIIVRPCIIWLAGILCLIFLSIWSQSTIALGCVAAILGLTILSSLLNLYLRKKVTVRLEVPASVEKDTLFTGILFIENPTWLPVGRIVAQTTFENRLTGEKSETYLRGAVAPHSKCTIPFEITCQYCGYLRISVERVYFFDMFGCIPFWRKGEEIDNAAILPDMFLANVILQMAMGRTDDSQNWSQYMKGNDYSEVFALREYIPGDGLNHIHWKLSSKRNQLITRDPSLPIEKSLLVYWDKNSGQSSPAEMDAMAEGIASVAQSIVNQGIPFVLGWTNCGEDYYETIDTEEDLLTAIPQMLKYGAQKGMTSSTTKEVFRGFGKIIYAARSLPEEMDSFSSAEITYLICDKSQKDINHRTISFSADSYQNDLGAIEL